MKTTPKTPFLTLILLSFLFLFSCRSSTDEPENTDPLIGNWKLKVVTANGQSQDVSNADCWKDTTLNVDKSMAKFHLSFSNGNGGGCQVSDEQYQWSNTGRTYYYTENGQQKNLPVKLLDNNQTLQLTLAANDGTVIFSFRK